MRKITLSTLCLISAILVATQSSAQDYPEMVGLWTGTVRVVSSGNIDNDRLDVGGMIITEIELLFTVDAQDGETFIGRSKTSTEPQSNPGTHVWGSIRSNGQEALFISDSGARGQIWFSSDTSFEYCLTDLADDAISAYCANLTKQ